MTGDSRPETKPASFNALLIIVGVLTLMVIGLGAAVVFVQLGSDTTPKTEAERDLNLWQRLADDNPESAWAQIGLGNALLAAGESDTAETAFEEALSLEPDSTEALFQLGLIAKGVDADLGLEYLRRSVESASGPDRARPLLALGDLHVDLGDWESASQIYAESIHELPFLLPAHLGLARSLEALGDFEGALAAYRQAERFNPNDPEILDAVNRLTGPPSDTTNP